MKAEKTKGSRSGGPYKRNTGRRQVRGETGARYDIPSTDQYESESEEEIEQEEPDQLNAYDALLTLLKPEEDNTKKSKKSTKAKSQSDDIEGLVEEDENGHPEEEEIQIEDDNEGDLKDPFELHFAAPNESVMEQAQDLEFVPQKSTILGDRSRLEIASDKLSTPISTTDLETLKVKYRLQSPFSKENGDLNELQKQFAIPLFAYQDILYPGRTVKNSNKLLNMVILHTMNHVYKTRDRVLKNNAKLSAAADSMEDLELRDQGFTRPKVLILLPTKNSAWKFINKIFAISGLNQSENKKRFKDAFWDPASPPPTKPDDFRDYFSGNNDDLFCLGVKFTRQAIKLYSSFYSSDLIIASPLGLQRVIGNTKNPDYDFLSSIELLIVDQADGIYYQNWDNVEYILKNMNQMPKEAHGCDFSRVREWYINHKAQFLRQTIILTEFTTAEMNHAMSKYCFNISGKLRIRSSTEGAMSRIGSRVRQTFTRLHCSSPVQGPDIRFKHFTAVLLPSLLRGANYTGTLIYIPSYNDFLRVRRYVEVEKINCTCISEYDEASHISKARTYFSDGRVKILIMSERFHHYRRYEIKGVNQVIMYGVPENPKFYAEAMRFMVRMAIERGQDIDMFRGRLLYTKFDNIALQRIVGTKRNGILMQGSSDTYEFH